MIRKNIEKARNNLLNLVICDLCYYEEYICEFSNYFHKGRFNNNEKPMILDLLLHKLPYPTNLLVFKDYKTEAKSIDTLGTRIKYVRNWINHRCTQATNIRNLLQSDIQLCCTKDKPSKYGCSRKYPKQIRNHYKRRNKKYI